jgi:small subunit ribosomal protein S1
MESHDEEKAPEENDQPAADDTSPDTETSKEKDEATTDFAELLEETRLPSTTDVKVGDRVRGRIVSIDEVDAFVDYGGRSEAVVTASELLDEERKPRYKVGDEIEAIVASVDDGVLLTLSGRSAALSTEELREAFRNRIPVEGLVKAINRGGFEVTVSGVRGFCPMSQIDSKYVESPSDFLGQKLSFRIVEWREGGKNLVLSRRVVMEEREKKRLEEVRAKIVEGAELEGRITRVQPFGVFVDLGGIEGLVHVSELSHGRLQNPADHFTQNQTVRVRVLKMEKLGESNERISLSLKALLPDPWESEVSGFHEGSIAKGRVVGLVNFGAFVELAPGLDGLIHLTELSHKRIRHPGEVVSVGDEVEVQVMEVDASRRRISLSLRRLEKVEEVQEAGAGLNVGDIVEGVVANVKPYGVFVDITSSELKMSGLIPVAETGESRDVKLHKKFPRGRKLQAEVVNIDEQGRVRLSLTSLRSRAEREGFETYKAGKKSQTAGTSLSIFADVLEKVKRRAEESKEDGSP